MTIFIQATLADGRVFKGPIQGNGGKLGSGALHAGRELALSEAVRRLNAAQRLAARGRDTGIFEPRPGFVAIYPDWNGFGDGQRVEIPLEGTRFEEAPKSWNPRYVLYAKAHGETDPEAMKAKDRERYPGGRMCGFMLWMRERWNEWRDLKGYGRDYSIGAGDHVEFDAWLAGAVS